MGELRDEVLSMMGEDVATGVDGNWQVMGNPPTDLLSLVAEIAHDLQRVVLRLAEEIEKTQATANEGAASDSPLPH
jgi:hypothetical protein